MVSRAVDRSSQASTNKRRMTPIAILPALSVSTWRGYRTPGADIYRRPPNRIAPSTPDISKDVAMTPFGDRGDGRPDLEAQKIEPDDKDWTWVLKRACPECGFDAGDVPGPRVAGWLREKAACWPAVCERADAVVRPAPQVWSPLEYACHVRDVCQVFESRVILMRSEEDPVFENWNQDVAAIIDEYGGQEPLAVGVELCAAAEGAAAAFEAVGEGEWERTGRRSNGSRFTIETLGQYFLHDVIHHLHDVRG
jgi:hypothetical protein